MGRFDRHDIENPEAYARAVQGQIYARATAKRAREWDAQHPQLAEWLNYTGYADVPNAEENGFQHTPHPLGPVPTFAREAREKWGSLTEKATATLQRIFDERTERNAGREAQRAAEAASALPWAAGRQVVVGQILTVKVVENDFGGAIKMLVKREDGSKLWTTVPSQLLGGQSSELRGLWVQFTVTVQPKQGEPTFAFGSRPAKASAIWFEEVQS